MSLSGGRSFSASDVLFLGGWRAKSLGCVGIFSRKCLVLFGTLFMLWGGDGMALLGIDLLMRGWDCLIAGNRLSCEGIFKQPLVT